MSEQPRDEEPLLELHELTQKGNAAVSEANRNRPDDRYTDYIKGAVKRAKDVMAGATIPLHRTVISGDKRLGLFLFNEDLRFTTAEIWITTEGKILEVLRSSREVRDVEPEEVYSGLGVNRFVNGIGHAFDEERKRKAVVNADNDAAEVKIKAVYGF